MLAEVIRQIINGGKMNKLLLNESLFRKIQFLANVAIVLIAVFLVGIVIKNFLATPEPAASAPSNVPANPKPAVSLTGKPMPLQNIDWAKNKKTLVLYISNKCHFCTESAPFYQRLAQEAAGKDIKLAAVLPQPVEQGQEYLKKLNVVGIDSVYQNSLSSLGVRGTPTILLVDENGKIINSWMGKLNSDRENQVLSILG
jgi:thiol-disulfide isomerase/thioredoxin